MQTTAHVPQSGSSAHLGTKQACTQGLVVRGYRNAALWSAVAETSEPRSCPSRADAASPPPADEEERSPVHTGLLDPEAIVFVTNRFTHQFQQARRLGGIGDRHQGGNNMHKSTAPSVANRRQAPCAEAPSKVGLVILPMFIPSPILAFQD